MIQVVQYNCNRAPIAHPLNTLLHVRTPLLLYAMQGAFSFSFRDSALSQMRV